MRYHAYLKCGSHWVNFWVFWSSENERESNCLSFTHLGHSLTHLFTMGQRVTQNKWKRVNFSGTSQRLKHKVIYLGVETVYYFIYIKNIDFTYIDDLFWMFYLSSISLYILNNFLHKHLYIYIYIIIYIIMHLYIWVWNWLIFLLVCLSLMSCDYIYVCVRECVRVCACLPHSIHSAGN